jgi:hypothetical protein
VGVRDHELHAGKAATHEALEEGRPEGLRFRGADVETDDLALAVRVDGHGNYRCDRDDAAALALL